MWFHKTSSDPRPPVIGLVQALGVFLYIVGGISIATGGLLEFVMPLEGTIFGPMMFLMLFCLSVLVCGSLTLLYPLKFMMEKRFQEAVLVLLWMVFWMAALMAVLLTIGKLIGPFVVID